MWRLRKIARFALGGWIVLAPIAVVAQRNAHAASVLYIHGEDSDTPGYLHFEQSLLEALYDEVGPQLRFYREQLDATRFPEYTERKLALLRAEYAGRHIDVIVFYGSSPVQILPGVPVVQVDNGLSSNSLEALYGHEYVHVTVKVDLQKTILVARRFQPDAHKVWLISGTGRDDLIYLAQFYKQIAHDPGIEVKRTWTESVQQLRHDVARLPRNTIVIPLSYSRDPEGHTYIPKSVAAQLAAVSSAPVYAISDTFVGVGTVGGYVVSWEMLGQNAARAAAELLRGTPPEQVRANPAGSSIYLFDWRQLQRWGFRESALPPGSNILFKTPTAWEQYRWRILSIIAFVVVEMLLSAALLVQAYKRYRVEDTLRDTAGRLLHTQDEERRRIARDLHDGTSQHLSGIALAVGQVLNDFPDGHGPLRRLLEESHTASRLALQEIRAISYALHPPMLDGIGLIPALTWYLDGLQQRTSFRITFETGPHLVAVSRDAQGALFRIVQESVRNIIRHSNGTALNVRISNGEKGLTLEVEDNGRGISDAELQKTENSTVLGVGIYGMKERVRELHGIFRVTSTSRGTLVHVSLPAQKEGSC